MVRGAHYIIDFGGFFSKASFFYLNNETHFDFLIIQTPLRGILLCWYNFEIQVKHCTKHDYTFLKVGTPNTCMVLHVIKLAPIRHNFWWFWIFMEILAKSHHQITLFWCSILIGIDAEPSLMMIRGRVSQATKIGRGWNKGAGLCYNPPPSGLPI